MLPVTFSVVHIITVVLWWSTCTNCREHSTASWFSGVLALCRCRVVLFQEITSNVNIIPSRAIESPQPKQLLCHWFDVSLSLVQLLSSVHTIKLGTSLSLNLPPTPLLLLKQACLLGSFWGLANSTPWH